MAVLPYVVWVLVLRVVIGAWPRGSVDGRLSLVPGAGMVDAVWNWRTEEWIAAGMVLTLAVAGLVLGRDRRLRLLLIAHLAMASVLGLPVWNRYVDFGRVLLPLTLISVLALASGSPGQRWPSTARRAARGPHATSTTVGTASTA